MRSEYCQGKPRQAGSESASIPKKTLHYFRYPTMMTAGTCGRLCSGPQLGAKVFREQSQSIG